MPKQMPPQKPGQSEQEVGTPSPFILAACRKLGIAQFSFDLAATRGVNNVAPDCFTREDDALVHDWPKGGWNYLNPEFSDIGPWVKKAYMQGRLGAATAVLIPASTGANWWKIWVDQKAFVLSLNGRITFVGHTTGYPKDLSFLLYGPSIEPGYEVWSWRDELTKEELMAAKQARPKKPRGNKSAEVVSTGGNELTDIVSTPTDLVLPTADDAVRLLAELATLNDQAIAAGKVAADLKDRAKLAKEKYDALAEQVLTRLQVGTHKSDLPLFSLDEREADQARMLAAPDAIQDMPDATQNDEQVEGDVIPAQPVTDALDAIQTDPAEAPGIF